MSNRVNAAIIAAVLFLLSNTSFGVSPAMSQEADQDIWSGLSLSVGVGAHNLDPKLDTDLNRLDLGSRRINNPPPGPLGNTIFNGASLQTGENLFSENDWKAFGTAQIAFDQKLGNFVIGAFADIDFGSDGENSYSVTGFDGNICTRNNNGVLPPPPALIPCPIAPDGIVGTVNIDYGTMWSVGGRAGYLVSPTWLIYGLVAYSEVNVDVSAHMIDPFPLNGGFRGDQPTNVNFDIDKLTGVTVGGGTEFQISKNLHFKLEYRYTEFEGEGSSHSDVRTVGNLNHGQLVAEDLSINLDSEVHSIRAAIVLKLGNL